MKYFFLPFLAVLVWSLDSSGQIAPSLTVPQGHKGIVRNCYFTPNDKYLVSTDNDHVLSVWDGDDGRQLFTLRDSSASFRKVEINHACSIITALTDSGRLYLIDFRTLKIKVMLDSIMDYSLHKKEEIIFFIRNSGAIGKYDPKKNTEKKIRVTTNLEPVKIISLSSSETCIQDATKGIFIINEITGKAVPVVTDRYSGLTLHDYHPETGYLLCTGFKAGGDGITYYNIEAKSRTVKGQVVVKGQYRNPDCLYTADYRVFIAANLSEDPDGYIVTQPPTLMSFKTGGVIRELGTEYMFYLHEMNLNFSRRKLVTESNNGPDRLFFLHDLISNKKFYISGEKNENEKTSTFTCANNSKKVAVFNKDMLLPAIYSDGTFTGDQPVGFKKITDLKINFSSVDSKKPEARTEKKMGFLLAGETALNDSVVFTTAPYDLSHNLYAGIVYYLKNGQTSDSLKFPYEFLSAPLPGSGQLYWISENRFYAMDIATRAITDSIFFHPGIKIRNIRQAGGNVFIDREDSLANPQYATLRYNIFRKHVTDTVFHDNCLFNCYEEINYSHRVEGYFISQATVRDYDYIRNTVFEYPFFHGRVDTVAVYDSTGEISAYQAVFEVPYLKLITDASNPGEKQIDLSDKTENLRIQQIRYYDKDRYVIMSSENKLFLYSVSQDTVLKKISCPTGKYSKLFLLKNKHIVLSNENRNDSYILDMETGNTLAHVKGFFNPVINQPADILLLQDAAFNNYYVYNDRHYQLVSTVTPFSKTEYVVSTSSGLFDGTDKAFENLYFLTNDPDHPLKPWKTIDLKQLKAKYFIPGLWDKLISGDSTDLPDVGSIRNISPAPEIMADSSYSFSRPYKITLLDKGGGIGPVSVVINGKEVIADARKNKVVTGKKITLLVDLQPYKKYFEPDHNSIQVFSSNTDSSLSSRGVIITSSNKSAPAANPRLFVISIGTSNYKGTEIDLQYSSKDATDMASALKAGSKNLFSADSTFIYTLVSDAPDSALLPSKSNIDRVFNEVGRRAAAKDIVVLYLSGHGINANGDFYYLTRDAYTANSSAYVFREVLQAVGISSNEFTEYLKKVAALKQLLIIDACASGKVVENLVAHRDIPFSTLKALDRLKDRTGTHIITGCAADAVSYEASRFGQGLLTYSLLEGMKGASLRENKFLDVAQWFQYARERVPQLAAGLGGIQTPQVYSPSGNQSFDIAEMDEEGKKQVPLAPEKPVFIKSIFQEEEKFADILSLGRQLDNILYETSSRTTKNPFMFFPVDEFPNAYQVLGRYKAGNNEIQATIKIIKGASPDAVSSFSLSSTDATSLSLLILGKIKELK